MKKPICFLLAVMLCIPLFAQILPVEKEYETIRPLFELNEEDVAEAYPWISDDGLRLYFTKGDASSSNILFSERPHVDSLFSEPVLMSVSSPEYESISSWLTNDELEIYVIVRGGNLTFENLLYKGTRESINDEFGSLDTIDLISENTGFISAPSLTPDKNQLFIFNTVFGNKILIFEKTGDLQYTEIGELEVPELYEPNPGNLTADGLKYYFSLDVGELEERLIYIAKRNSLDDDFEEFYLIQNPEISEKQNFNILPFASSDGRFLVFVRSPLELWFSDDIFIAQNSGPVSVFDVNNIDFLKVFPNPTSKYVEVGINSEYCRSRELSLKVLDYQGRLVETNVYEAGWSSIILNVDAYSSGEYFLQCNCSNMYFGAGKFTVAK